MSFGENCEEWSDIRVWIGRYADTEALSTQDYHFLYIREFFGDIDRRDNFEYEFFGVRHGDIFSAEMDCSTVDS